MKVAHPVIWLVDYSPFVLADLHHCTAMLSGAILVGTSEVSISKVFLHNMDVVTSMITTQYYTQKLYYANIMPCNLDIDKKNYVFLLQII